MVRKMLPYDTNGLPYDVYMGDPRSQCNYNIIIFISMAVDRRQTLIVIVVTHREKNLLYFDSSWVAGYREKKQDLVRTQKNGLTQWWKLGMVRPLHWGRESPIYTSYGRPFVSYGNFLLTICCHMVTFTVSMLPYDTISHHSS